MAVVDFKDLRVWQAALDLTAEVYKVTEGLPKHEQYGLVSQMRRAAASIPANIAEGHGRQHDKELCQFLFIAKGSLSELQTYLYLCNKLVMLDGELIDSLLESSFHVGRMLNSFIQTVRRQSVSD